MPLPLAGLAFPALLAAGKGAGAAGAGGLLGSILSPLGLSSILGGAGAALQGSGTEYVPYTGRVNAQRLMEQLVPLIESEIARAGQARQNPLAIAPALPGVEGLMGAGFNPEMLRAFMQPTQMSGPVYGRYQMGPDDQPVGQPSLQGLAATDPRLERQERMMMRDRRDRRRELMPAGAGVGARRTGDQTMDERNQIANAMVNMIRSGGRV